MSVLMLLNKSKRGIIMKFTAKKRHFMLAGLVLALGVAVLANWYYTEPNKNPVLSEDASELSNVNNANLGDAIYVNSTDISDEYFAGAKMSRDESYDEAVATLKEIIENDNSDEQSVLTAAESINNMTEIRIAQVNIENLVKAKTGSECIAVITDDSIEVVVNESVLNSETILQIKEIVLTNTDISAEKISIIGTK